MNTSDYDSLLNNLNNTHISDKNNNNNSVNRTSPVKSRKNEEVLPTWGNMSGVSLDFTMKLHREYVLFLCLHVGVLLLVLVCGVLCFVLADAFSTVLLVPFAYLTIWTRFILFHKILLLKCIITGPV